MLLQCSGRNKGFFIPASFFSDFSRKRFSSSSHFLEESSQTAANESLASPAAIRPPRIPSLCRHLLQRPRFQFNGL